MAAHAFNGHKSDVLTLHHDIDRLISLTTMLCAEMGSQRTQETVRNARAIYAQVQDRREAAGLSPDEDSVIEAKLDRVRTRLRFLGEI